DHVEDLALGDVADGNRDGLAGVAHFLATDDAVCGLEGDGTDQVVAEVLCNLERDLSRLFADRDRGLQCVVDVRNRVVRELDVDNRTVDACDAPGDRGRRLVSRSGGGHFFVSFLRVCQLDASASAPPTISAICWVMSAWRALLRRRV